MIQIYPSKLPLDISSKSSLNEHCDQYKFVASLFNSLKIDGFLCAGFTIEEELKCALTGIRKVSDKTIVFDKSAFNNSEILDADFAPSSSKYYCFDYSKMNSIDELLDEAISKVNFGVQFLNVRSASPSKTAALFALTDKMDCCLDG